ncbi:hypothetical protein G9A89_016505 [Geosiphon pyriformis]|nr:hypothetical protein G9A89_016505 [Geosiphon pyriformis]
MYLECFHRNLHQIQAIQVDYFIAPQILNQFIRGLHSSIFQCIHLLHPTDLQAAVNNARDFEATELKANHSQAINLEMRLVSKISSVYYHHQITHGSLRCMSATTVQPTIRKSIQKPRSQISDPKLLPKSRSISTHLSANNAAANLSTTSISSSNLSAAVTSNISITTISNLLTPTNSNTISELTSKQNPQTKNDTIKLKIGNGNLPTNPQSIQPIFGIISQNYLSFLIIPENASSNNLETNQKSLTNNIPPATVTNDKLLTAIFLFEFEKLSFTLLFSRAVFEEKPITIMYTDAKINGHSIKLILDIDQTANAKIITADGTTKTPIGKIDNLPIEINGIIVLIKVLVMEATQYQALVVFWANKDSNSNGAFGIDNELSLILFWNDKRKKTQKEEPTWNANQAWVTDNDQDKITTWKWKEDNNKKKEKEKDKGPTLITTYSPYAYSSPLPSNYH